MSDVLRSVAISYNHDVLAVPNKTVKFLKQTLEEDCEVVQDIVNSCDGYLHPVPAPSIASNLNENESAVWCPRSN